MAVYTAVDAADLIALLRRYDLGALESFSGITDGVENSNFLVRTQGQRCILTLYEKRVRTEELPFFLALMRHLSERGLHCPLPLSDRDGRVLHTLSDRPAALFSFLEGQSPQNITPTQCGAVGVTLAHLHRIGQDFPLRRCNALGPQAWSALAADCLAAAADDAYPGITAPVLAELAFLDRAWPQDLPSGLCHADLFPDNVFFQGDMVSGVIDFYFACTESLAYDLAICLNAWCFGPEQRFDRARGCQLLAGYQQQRPLTAAERAALPTLARGAALRFLLTRLYDSLHHPIGALTRPKDPLEYLSYLAFHQGTADAAAYGLD